VIDYENAPEGRPNRSSGDTAPAGIAVPVTAGAGGTGGDAEPGTAPFANGDAGGGRLATGDAETESRAIGNGAQAPHDGGETGVADPGPRLGLPQRDVRRKRPPLLSFLLRVETLRRLCRVGVLLVLDFVGVTGALLTALLVKLALRGDLSLSAAWHDARSSVAFAYLVTVLLFARVDLYADRPRRPGLAKIASALFQVMVIALVFALANGNRFSSYFIFYGSLFFAIVYVTSLRALFTRVAGVLLDRAGMRRRAILIGSGAHIEAVARAMATGPRRRVDVVGFISLTPRPENGLRCLGPIDELSAILAAERVQEVIIADPDFPQERALDVVDTCHRRGVTVVVAPSTMEILIDRAEFVAGESVPLFTLRPPVFEGVDYALKRTFDLVMSSFLLLFLSPLLLALAAAVRISSRGPVIYRSVRPGMAGIPFRCFKFRTMREHADQIQDDLELLNEQSGALFKIRQDPRLTMIGRVLRRFSLDELPQLVNVVRGEMSLVGPRPLPMRDFERLEEWHKKRYLVLPGITGLWQVSGRAELDFDDLVRLDFLYLEHWSIFLDLSILLKTIPAVLSRRGAF
jgi:exopolysaccharide biosynthesis polyprenyl glycosylphosphotransferase